MEIIYGNHLMKSFMEIIYVNHLCKSFMEIIYGNHLLNLGHLYAVMLKNMYIFGFRK